MTVVHDGPSSSLRALNHSAQHGYRQQVLHWGARIMLCRVKPYVYHVHCTYAQPPKKRCKAKNNMAKEPKERYAKRKNVERAKTRVAVPVD